MVFWCWPLVEFDPLRAWIDACITKETLLEYGWEYIFETGVFFSKRRVANAVKHRSARYLVKQSTTNLCGWGCIHSLQGVHNNYKLETGKKSMGLLTGTRCVAALNSSARVALVLPRRGCYIDLLGFWMDFHMFDLDECSDIIVDKCLRNKACRRS